MQCTMHAMTWRLSWVISVAGIAWTRAGQECWSVFWFDLLGCPARSAALVTDCKFIFDTPRISYLENSSGGQLAWYTAASGWLHCQLPLELATNLRRSLNNHGEGPYTLLVTGPSSGWKHMLAISHLRHYYDTQLIRCQPMVNRHEIGPSEIDWRCKYI